MSRLHLLLAAALLGGCPGGRNDDPCDPDPCASDPSTVCVEGACLDHLVEIVEVDGGVSGTHVDAGGTVVTSWSATPGADGAATASFTREAETVSVALTGPEAVSITVGGLTLDGDGALTEDEAAAVLAFSSSELADAIAMIGLEAACNASGEADPAALAALLAPWQLALKYADPDRRMTVQDQAGRASCVFFPNEDGLEPTPRQNLVILAPEQPIPAVFGILPFDAEGEAVASRRALGDHYGPCSSRCRGACGADCTTNNCTATGKDVCEPDPGGNGNSGWVMPAVEYECGTHEGCELHDNCYDTCNGVNGCDTWGAATCRRGCDQEACYEWPTECARWAAGFGTHTSKLKWVYPDAPAILHVDTNLCPITIGGVMFQDPAADDLMLLSEGIQYCQDLVHMGFDDWFLPSRAELELIRVGCEPVCQIDGCTGCAWESGPNPNGCYYHPALRGYCGAYWTSTPFAYATQYTWVELFSTGGSAITHGEVFEYGIRCARYRLASDIPPEPE